MSGRINNVTRGLIFWCTLGELVLPVAAQVDQQKSRNYFDEARVICERDGGRLWGVSLCGPMVFADARTQTFATNQPPPAADRPRALGFANAPIEWGGQTWAAYIWDFITVDDPQHRGVLMLHELFHRIQPQLGLRAPNGHNDHLDTVEGRYWLQLEWRALARALRLSGYRRTEAIRDALAFRLNRHGVFPGAAENERRDEIREGLAQYTGTVAAARSAADAVGSSIAQLADAERQATFVGTFAYTSGAAYGILLDALLPNWRRQVQATSDLAQLLKAAAGIQPTQKLSDASSNYGGAELRATEGKREEQQRARVADLRRQFVEGPVLLLPRAGGATLDTRGATPIPGSGIVYVSYRVNGEWGSLRRQMVSSYRPTARRSPCQRQPASMERRWRVTAGLLLSHQAGWCGLDLDRRLSGASRKSLNDLFRGTHGMQETRACSLSVGAGQNQGARGSVVLGKSGSIFPRRTLRIVSGSARRILP